MVKKIIAISLVIVLIVAFAFVSCSNNSQVVMPLMFNPDLKCYNIASVVAAENSKYQLSWDSDNRRVQLVDKSDGYVWSSTPTEVLSGDYTEPLTTAAHKMMLSSISIDCVAKETYSLKTFYGYQALEEGNFSVSQIEGGLRVTYVFREAKISIPVQYLLFEDGIKIKIDPAKIAEDGSEYFLHTVAVAPFMCSAKNLTEDSYLLYPSGSGALVYMDKEDNISLTYASEVYGTDGMTDLKTWAKESNEANVKLPVYGSKFGDRGMFAIIDGNAEAATIQLNAFNKKVGYSTVYSEFALRGETNVSNKFLQSADNSMKYAEAYTLSPISVSFYPLKGEEASYTEMAGIYRDYLVDRGLTKKDPVNDVTVKYLGGAMIKSSFLGIPTTKMFATTTLEEAEEMTNELSSLLNTKLNVDLVGYGDKGMTTGKVAGGFTINSKLGGKKGLKDFYQSVKSKGNNVYLDFDLIGIKDSGKSFSALTDVAVTTTKQRFGKIKYRLATNNSAGDLFYYISRNSLLDVSNKMINFANSLGIDSIALDSVSNISYSDYNYQQYFSKAGMSDDVSTIFKNAENNKLNVMANDANSYAAVLADIIVDVPIESSRHDAFTYDIPFYQMVFSGYVSMFAPSVNLSNDENMVILKAVESGVGLSYTLIKNYDSGLKSVFDFYHGLSYDDLKASIVSNYNNTADYYKSIKGQSIAEYNILENGLRETVFSNGVTVYVNYSDEAVSTPFGDVAAKSFVYGNN